MNDLDLCLEAVSKLCQPLRYIRRWISRKPLEIEAFFQRTTNRKWATGIKWSRDQRRHVTLKGQTSDTNTARAQYLENSWRCYLATIANYCLVCCEAVRSAILATCFQFVKLVHSDKLLHLHSLHLTLTCRPTFTLSSEIFYNDLQKRKSNVQCRQPQNEYYFHKRESGHVLTLNLHQNH